MSDSELSSLASFSASDIRNDVPIQLDATSHGKRKQSILRRLSTAASGPISYSSESLRSKTVAEEADGLFDLTTESITHDELFGRSQVTKQLTKGSTDEDLEDSLETYDGFDGTNDGNVPPQPLQRRRRSTVVSTIQTITRKLGFWEKEFHADRINIILTYLNNYLYLIIGFMLALCIYWGSYYNRTSRYKNVKFAVVIADNDVGELPAILGPVIKAFFTEVPVLKLLGDFHIIDSDQINEIASAHNNTVTEEVYRQVHHQNYWAAFYVKPNATLTFYQALKSASNSFSPAETLLEVVYETGRDYNAVNNYISTIVQSILKVYYQYVPNTPLVINLLDTLNSTEQLNVINNAPDLLTTLPTFKVNDRIPIIEQVVQAPLQIGLIYLCIFTFFQFIFQIQIHMYIASKIKGMKYVAYRMLASQVAYFVLSLGYVVLNRAFGIKYSTTFGKSGFLVVWSFAYLTMSSLGSLIEMLALILIIVKPQLIGFALLFIAVVNVSPTVSPIVLCPDFYRYGYAIPVRNSYELMHVAYFNAWKGTMGRNIGILFVWIVLTNSAMPFVMKWMSVYTAKKLKATEESKSTTDTNEDENKES